MGFFFFWDALYFPSWIYACNYWKPAIQFYAHTLLIALGIEHNISENVNIVNTSVSQLH